MSSVLLNVVKTGDSEVRLSLRDMAKKAGYDKIELKRNYMKFIKSSNGNYITVSNLNGTCYGNRA